MSNRTLATAKNSTIGLASQVLNILLSFVSRTIFINTLGITYLGLNGLFSNILMILSFAELGIGNAIIFGLYKPIAYKNEKKIKDLLNFYSKTYRVIASIILMVGLITAPFIHSLIGPVPEIKESIHLIYILFLLDVIFSYFYAFKKSIIIADQKNYVVLFYQMIFRAFQISLQIFVLLTTNNFILYLVIQIVFTALNNLYISHKANMLYPFLKQMKGSKLEIQERKELFVNIKSLILYKFSTIIFNGTDNIIIAVIINISTIGINSNYILIIAAITAITSQVLNGFTASLGNLNVTASKEEKYRIFNLVFLISAWVAGFFSVGLMLFFNPFIIQWLGVDYIFEWHTVLAIVLNFYVISCHFAVYSFKTTAGYFKQGRIFPVIGAFANILLSILLGKYYGISGILFATSISRLITYGVSDPIVVHKLIFDKSSKIYQIKYYLFLMLFIGIFFLSKFFVDLILIGGLFDLLFAGIVFAIVFNGLMLIIFWKSTELRSIRYRLNSILKFHKNKD